MDVPSALDISFDDIIKKNKKSSAGKSRGPGRGPGPGPARPLPNRFAPYSVGKVRLGFSYPGRISRSPSDIKSRSSLLESRVSNLISDPGSESGMAARYVPELDGGFSGTGGWGISYRDGNQAPHLQPGLRDLQRGHQVLERFSEVGNLKPYSIHCDWSQRSRGTAEVVFSSRGDALAAVKRYNNVLLDGKPMKIETVGTNTTMPAVVSHVLNVSYGKLNGVSTRWCKLFKLTAEGKLEGKLRYLSICNPSFSL